jgi:hypothetical protein
MAGPIAVPNRFTVTSGGQTFDLDIKGRAFQSGSQVGSWKTSADNKIVITRNDTQTFTVSAAWRWNDKNQMIAVINGTDAFNFQSDTTLNPNYETRNAVLRFTPDVAGTFTIEIRGAWALTVDHNMLFTPTGSAASTLTGFINSPEGKFIFFFNDADRPLRKYKLGFIGEWQNALDANGKPKEGQLVFVYRTEDGTQAKFELPKAITINKTTNQLRYEYQKGGLQSIDFVGTLVVNDDFSLSYSISRRVSNTGETMVRETVVGFGAVFQKTNFQGNLELTLKKADGSTGSTTLTVRGDFTAVLGKTNLQAGFRFDQIREGQTITTTFGFAGQLQTKGATVQWAFTTSNAATRTIDLSVGADIQLGGLKADARLNLTMADGSVKGVTFLLGINF